MSKKDIGIEMLESAPPLFRISVNPCKVTLSTDLLKIVKRNNPSIFKTVQPNILQKIWKLYSVGKFDKALIKIAALLKKIQPPMFKAFCTLWTAEIAKQAKQNEKSIKLYEEAANSFGLLEMPWFSYFSLTQRLSLKGPTSLELKKVLVPEVPPEVRVPSVSFGYSEYKILLEKVFSAKTKNEKKKSLEDLAAFLFSSIHPSISILRNILTTTEEIDLLLKNEAPEPFWQRLGSPILVECKNWARPVGTSVIRDLKGKMEYQGIRTGILLSLSGITGNEWKAAKLYLKQQKATGYYIIYLSKEDLKDIANGVAPPQKISERYYWLFTI